MAETRNQVDARLNEVRDDLQNRETTGMPDTGTRDYSVRQSAYTAGQTMSDDPDTIEREMEQTRREMAETLGELQERLDPERLKFEAEWRVDQAIARAKNEVEDATIGRVKEMTVRATEKASNWRTNMMHTIRENPVPAALVGVGLGWLIMENSGRNGEQRTPGRYGQRRYDYDEYAYGSYGYGDYAGEDWESDRYYRGQRRGEQGMTQRVGDRAEDIRDRAQDLREEATERVSEATDEIRSRAEHLRDEATEQFDELRDEARQQARRMQAQARMQTRHAKRSMEHVMRENPLALGAAALALGIIVGWAAPATETESRLMGEYRDDLIDQARHKAQEVRQEVEASAKEVVEDVKQEAKATAERTTAKTSEGTSSGSNRS